MKIRTLDWDRNQNTLEVFRSNDGDVHVRIDRVNDDDPSCSHVRIGMVGNSGHEMPSRIRYLFGQLADEFKKYEDCDYDKGAALKESLQIKNAPSNLLRVKEYHCSIPDEAIIEEALSIAMEDNCSVRLYWSVAGYDYRVYVTKADSVETVMARVPKIYGV